MFASKPICRTSTGNPMSPTTSSDHGDLIKPTGPKSSSGSTITPAMTLSVTAHQTVTGDIVIETLQNSGDSHGFPASILTDNALVYTTRFSGGRGGRNALEVFCVDTGIHQKHSRPVHPTTCDPRRRLQTPPQSNPQPNQGPSLPNPPQPHRHHRNYQPPTGRPHAPHRHRRHHTGTPIVMIIDNLDIRVIDHTTGQLLVDPTRDYQPQ
jgi:hypothetical protein